MKDTELQKILLFILRTLRFLLICVAVSHRERKAFQDEVEEHIQKIKTEIKKYDFSGI